MASRVHLAVGLMVSAVIAAAGGVLVDAGYQDYRDLQHAGITAETNASAARRDVEALQLRLQSHHLKTSVPVPLPSPGAAGPAGVSGARGPVGPPGAHGRRGKPGPRGRRGASITGPAGASGPAGTNGKDGTNGAQGDPGPSGPPGATGPPPAGFTFTYAGVTYDCEPTSPGASTYDCEPQPTPTPTP